MLENPAFNENNEKILCEMNGKNPEMHMNIRVKKRKDVTCLVEDKSVLLRYVNDARYI